MAGIPEDLIFEILLRLPVEALLRFRCVSKSWLKLIDSPNFVKSQLNLPNKPQFVMAVVCREKLRIYYSKLDSDYIENPSPNFRELTIPSRDEIFSHVSDSVGYCNGLLCFLCQNDRGFVVLNPFTGKHIQVPPPPEQGCTLYASGFGYDRDSDDYKVVALVNINDWGDNYCGVLWVYSLKSSSWKNIHEFRSLYFSGNGVFVDGALHWIAGHRKGDLPDYIFALNLGNLEYFSVPHPRGNSRILCYLGVVDGCLYTIRGYPSGYNLWQVWVMKEYGLKQSWTRLGTYNGFYTVRDFLFVSYGDSEIHRKFKCLWTKIWNDSSFHICKQLVYEPSLVCARTAI